MSRAVFLTSAAARATPRVCSRVSGDEMPTDATISPCGSRIGAATHLTSSRYSPSSSANPSTRTCAQTRARRVSDLTRRAGVDPQRRPPEQLAQGVEIAVGEQRLAVRRAVQRREFAGLPRHGHHLADGDVVVDEEHLDALADREVRRLAERGRQVLQVMVEERAQHGAPVAA